MALEIVSNPGQIGAVVRTHRKRAGLTLAELAQVLGMSVSGLSDMETGRSSPSIHTLWAVCAVLGISIWIDPHPQEHC